MGSAATPQSLGSVTFVDPDGKVRLVQVPLGESVMQAAMNSNVRGIDAICGGACACATCHVYVDPDWAARTGAADDIETAMLELVFEPRATSRLSCQILMTPDLDGLVVHIPEKQQ